MLIPSLIGIALIVVLLAWIAGSYNALVSARNEVKNAWAQIDVQLKRRHDLIPNLVETVKGYMEHERGTLEAVVKARQQAVTINSDNVDDVAKMETALGKTLKSLFAVAENYPDLKANQNFIALQEEITSTENKISFARQFYNDAVLNLNNKTEMFPSNLFASIFNFKAASFFEVTDEQEREVPQVKF